MLPERAKERLLRWVEKSPGGCWMWKHTITTNGYGNIMVNGKRYRAHRLSYMLFVGDIPDGLEVCHKCDVKLCVNPEHLYAGTHDDNIHDLAMRGTTGPKKRVCRTARDHDAALAWIFEYLGDDHKLTPQELSNMATMLEKYAAHKIKSVLTATRHVA